MNSLTRCGVADGKDYVAKVRLSDREDRTLAAIGETCERVPAESLEWLIADGHVEPVPVPQASPIAAPVAPVADEE